SSAAVMPGASWIAASALSAREVGLSPSSPIRGSLTSAPLRPAGRRPPCRRGAARRGVGRSGRGSGEPPVGRRVLADATVDGLPQQVGVAGVPGVLLEEVDHQPSEADHDTLVGAEGDLLVETAGVDGVGEPLPGPRDAAVPGRVEVGRRHAGGVEGVLLRAAGVAGHARPGRSVARAGEVRAPLLVLDAREVLHQTAEREARGTDGARESVVVEAVDLPAERRPLAVQGAEEVLDLGAVEGWLRRMATTSMPSRQVLERSESQSLKTDLERPSTMSSSLDGPVPARTGVRSMITVTYFSPRRVWRQV